MKAYAQRQSQPRQDGKLQGRSARRAHARTAGQDVVFGPGRYAPGADEGRRLLAHELAHTLQQGQAATTVQRALKFEIQVLHNFVWAVKKSGTPDPQLLPRKYAPTSVGYKEGAGEERGDRPAYLTVGKKGGPARPAGHEEGGGGEGADCDRTPVGARRVPGVRDAEVVPRVARHRGAHTGGRGHNEGHERREGDGRRGDGQEDSGRD